MLVRQDAAGLEVWAPAKLNLFLEILGRREDGFHELETLICPIDLFDTLRCESNSTGQIEFCSQIASGSRDADASSAEALPEGSDNIVVRAARLLRERSGVREGASIRLTKRIPIAAGLAGGSSDAAAALVAVNRLWGLDWPPGRLAELGAELGSDIPFFFCQSAAVCRGRGERIEPFRGSAPLQFVVVTPPRRLLTADVFARCRPAATPRPMDPLLRALRAGDAAGTGRLFHNRLAPTAEAMAPEVGRLRRKCDRLDVWGHGLTGTGTSYFALCRHAKHARQVAGRLRAQGVGSVYAVRSSP